MKKRSIAAKLGVAALALTLVTTSLSSGTLAKYQTKGAVGATFTVAKWNVSASMVQPDGTLIHKMTTSVTDVQLASTATTTPKDGRVTTTGGMIAPGMGGKFGIQVDTNDDEGVTDVAVEYDIYIKPEGDNFYSPTNFKLWDATENPTGTGTGITMTGNPLNDDGWRLTGGTIPANQSGETRSITRLIGWQWPYEDKTDNSYDADDTVDGEGPNAGKPQKYLITVVMTQANPNTTPDTNHPTPSPTPAG